MKLSGRFIISFIFITLLLCLILLVVHNVISLTDLDWYESINKPFMWPRVDIFVKIWAIFFFVIYACILWDINEKASGKNLLLYLIIILLGLFWAIAFFEYKNLIGGVFISAFTLLLLAILLKNMSKNFTQLFFGLYMLWYCLILYYSTSFYLTNTQ